MQRRVIADTCVAIAFDYAKQDLEARKELAGRLGGATIKRKEIVREDDPRERGERFDRFVYRSACWWVTPAERSLRR